MNILNKIKSIAVGVLCAATVSSEAAPIFKGRAIFTIKKEWVGSFEAAIQEIIEPTRKESGNISYEAYRLIDENGALSNKFEFHELWKSKKAMMEDHKEKAPHMRAFFKKLQLGTPKSWVESFEVDGHEVLTIEGN